MPIDFKEIALDSQIVVRDVDALEGIAVTATGTGMIGHDEPHPGAVAASTNVRPGKWVNIQHATNRNWWGNVIQVTNDSITAGGNAVPRPWKYLRLFAFSSYYRTYSYVLINHLLQPGQQIEISFYASQGANLTDTGSDDVSGGSATSNSASEDQDIAIQVLYSTSAGTRNDINKLTAFSRHPFIFNPDTGVAWGTSSNGSLRSNAPGGRTATTGDGDIYASNGSNVGAINGGWRYSTARDDENFTQADFTARPADVNKIGRLYAENVPDESGGGYTRFFQITIRNDTELPALLKLKPYNWNATYEYYTFYDFRIKVTSSVISSTLGDNDDMTHFKHGLSPKWDTGSSTHPLNMMGRKFINIGNPWPQPAWNSPNFVTRGDWPDAKDSTSTEVKLAQRNQLVSNEFYNAWSNYHTPVVASFGNTGHTSTAQWINLSGMETGTDCVGNGASDPEQYALRAVVRLMPFDGRLHSMTIRTQNVPPKIMTARLYKYTGNLPYQNGAGGPIVYDTTASITEIGAIVFDKSTGIRGADEEAVTGFLKYSNSNNGSFSFGEILMMRIDSTKDLGVISGTITFLRGDL